MWEYKVLLGQGGVSKGCISEFKIKGVYIGLGVYLLWILV